jgi:acyl-CoA synthetase (AMP-forming)/AMP-acid ligase II
MINDTEFVFIGRNAEIINIGGRNVNPSQIEDVITNHPKISQAVVYTKSNKLLGNILACKVVSTEVTENEIRSYLKEKIKEGYKIPRIINLVDSVLVSKNNKVVR